MREKQREDSSDGKGFKMQTNIGTKSRLNYHLNSTACHFKQWMSHVSVCKGRANNLIPSQQAVSSLYTSCVFPPIDLKSICRDMPCCNLLQRQTNKTAASITMPSGRVWLSWSSTLSINRYTLQNYFGL